MMCLIIGDIHCKITNFLAGKRFLLWLNEVNYEYKPELIVHLGDFFDSHAVLRAEILSEYANHIQTLCDSPHSPSVVHVLGNHEFFKPNSSLYHALQALKNIHNGYHVIDQTTDLLGMTFVPYQVDLASFPKDTKPICFAHQTFIGADFGHYRPDKGVDMDGVSADLIISGHVHKGQRVGKVFYPGSPFAQDANDIDQVKGVYIFDTDTYDFKFISTPLPRWCSCSFSSIDEAGTLNIDTIHSELLSTLTVDDYWIINLKGPRVELIAYIESERFLNIKKLFNVRLRVKFIDKDKERIQIKALTSNDAVSQYIDKVYTGDLNKEILKNKAFELLKQIKR